MRLKKKFVRATSFAMAAAMMLGMSLPAFAARYNIGEGSVTVNGGIAQTVTQNNNTAEDDDPVIYGSTTANTLIINAKEGDAKVTLENVNIDVSSTGGYNRNTHTYESGEAAVTVNASKGNTATIELDGQSTVQSGYGRAGVEKNGSSNTTGTLVIQDKDTTPTESDEQASTSAGTAGSLTVTGGEEGAGIGGGSKSSTGNITITGGTIDADGGYYGAGIGGGNRGSASNITISGGTVDAYGGGGAGIGGGEYGDGNNITISGGSVRATTNSCGGAGIGGGYDNNGNNITITGGDVYARGSSFGGAGIGGGWSGGASNISITGGNVEAKGGSGDGNAVGADIGAGCYKSSGDYLTGNVLIGANANITLSGTGTIGNGRVDGNKTEKVSDKTVTYTVHDGAEIRTSTNSAYTKLAQGNASTYLENAKGSITVCVSDLTAATCTEQQKYNNGTIAVSGTALGHDYQFDRYTKEPTCTEVGTAIYKCSRSNCTAEQTREVRALGHSFSTEYRNDANGHWYACTHDNCTAKDGESSHTAATNTDCTKDTVCTDCGYVLVKGNAEHSYSSYSKDTTSHWQECTNDGCDHTTEKTEHSFTDYGYNNDATCTADGTETGTCVCGETYKRTKANSALGHDYTNAEVTYTWTQDNDTGAWTCKATRTCTRNGCTHVDEATTTNVAEVETSHKDATCMDKGSKTYKATFTEDWANAPKTQSEDIDINENAHQYATDKATFSWQDNADGTAIVTSAERECTLNHDHTKDTTKNVVVTEDTSKRIAPTCTKEGAAYYTATATFKYDNEEKAVEIKSAEHAVTLTINPLNHAWSDWAEKTPATCGANKVEERHCTRTGCTKTETREVAGTATGAHSWKLTDTTKAATCDEDGEGTYTCEVCKATKTGVIAKLTETGAHTWELTETIEKAACDNDGKGTYTCTVCGQTKTDVIAKLSETGEHTWELTKTIEKAACDKDGKGTYTCTVCGKTKTDVIAKLTETGEHSWELTETIEKAACDNDGKGTYTCTVCGQTKEDVIAKLTETGEHSWELTETIEKAACDKDGKGTYTCTVCGKTKIDVIAKLSENGEHSWNDGEITTAATTEAEGVKTYTCTACGATKTEPIEKLTPAPAPTPVTPEQGGNEGGETEQPTTPDHGGAEQTTPATPTPVPVQPTEKPATPTPAPTTEPEQQEQTEISLENVTFECINTAANEGKGAQSAYSATVSGSDIYVYSKDETLALADTKFTGSFADLRKLYEFGAENIIFVAQGTRAKFSIGEILRSCTGSYYTVTFASSTGTLRGDVSGELYGKNV